MTINKRFFKQRNSGFCHVVERLMIALVIVVIHEAPDPLVQLARQVVVLQQNLVLQRLVPTLDLTLRLRVIRPSSSVPHAVLFQEVCHISFTLLVGCENLSLACIRMYAGLVIRS